jgi:hypothetical protein
MSKHSLIKWKGTSNQSLYRDAKTAFEISLAAFIGNASNVRDGEQAVFDRGDEYSKAMIVGLREALSVPEFTKTPQETERARDDVIKDFARLLEQVLRTKRSYNSKLPPLEDAQCSHGSSAKRPRTNTHEPSIAKFRKDH